MPKFAKGMAQKGESTSRNAGWPGRSQKIAPEVLLNSPDLVTLMTKRILMKRKTKNIHGLISGSYGFRPQSDFSFPGIDF